MSSEALPSSLRSCVPYPETPWRMSPDLYTRVQTAPGPSAYKRCEVLPSDPEHAFIFTYFQAAAPVNRHIKAAYVIHNASATSQFEAALLSRSFQAFFRPQSQSLRNCFMEHPLRKFYP